MPTVLLLLAASLFSGAPPASDDPFGAAPLGASPNCGPESRQKLDRTVGSKADFVAVLKSKAMEALRLDDFRPAGSAEVDWAKVLAAVKLEKVAKRSVYSLVFHPADCSPAQQHTLKVTSDGHVSLYGCCGK
jgi:hypothetical protein